MVSVFMQKGDDPGKFRQLDEILFVEGFPDYQQLMCIVGKCMQVVCEVKGDEIAFAHICDSSLKVCYVVKTHIFFSLFL